MTIAKQAYEELFPGSTSEYDFDVEYSGRFKDFGAQARMRGRSVTFHLSKKWLPVSEDIQIGLIQELMLKLMKKKKRTINIDLYNSFVKNLHLAIPKTKSDPQLDESFIRVNEQYFLGLVEQPNLKWGQDSTRTFGTYDFKTDTIRISTIFKETETKYLDYIMFHEVLHKQRKFFKSGTKTYYHDKKFKTAEKIFKDSQQIEKDLGKIARSAKLKQVREAKPASASRSFFWWR